MSILTQGFDGSAPATLARIPGVAGAKGRAVVSVAATATAWIAGWRSQRTVRGDPESDQPGPFQEVESEQVVAGPIGGTPRTLVRCRPHQRSLEDLPPAISVTADAGTVAFGGAICAGHQGVWAWTTDSAGPAVRLASGDLTTYPVLAGPFIGYLGESLVLADASTGAILRDTGENSADVRSYDLDDDGTLVYVTSGPPSALLAATPSAAPRPIGTSGLHGGVLTSGGLALVQPQRVGLETLNLSSATPVVTLGTDLPLGELTAESSPPLAVTEDPGSLMSFDGRRAVYRDETCAGSEITIDPLNAPPATERPPADCPVTVLTRRAGLVRGAFVRIAVHCLRGCANAEVTIAGHHASGSRHLSAPAGGNGAVTLRLPLAARRTLQRGAQQFTVTVKNRGRDNRPRNYAGRLSVHR